MQHYIFYKSRGGKKKKMKTDNLPSKMILTIMNPSRLHQNNKKWDPEGFHG